MQCNVGSTEKLVRVTLGIALLTLLYFVSGPARYLGLLGLVPMFTGFIGWCPINAVLGINTFPSRRGRTA